MGFRKIARYGDWDSPITAELLLTKSRALSSPRVCAQSGKAFYTETKENGNNCIMEVCSGSVRDVLLPEYSARNSVYEYGGSAFDVLLDGRIIFSNSDDTVHLLEPDTRRVSRLVGKPTLRYSNFSSNPMSPWVLAVEEDHEHDTPAQVMNYVVAIHVHRAEVRRVVSGADFYYTPQFSPDGSKLAWLSWSHPELPFSAAKLFCAEWADDGSISNITLVAGAEDEGVAEPRWGVDGSLFFGRELNGFRQLYRLAPGGQAASLVKLDGLETSEIGQVLWFQGSRSYAALSERHLIAAPVLNGVAKLVLVDLDTSSWRQVTGSDVLVETAWDAIARLSSTSALVIGTASSSPQTLYEIDLGGPVSVRSIREAIDEMPDNSYISQPERIRVSSKSVPRRSIYGILWMPKNPRFQAPEGHLPPLIMTAHSGPTGHIFPGFTMRIQYFTSRGYAVFCLNYTGSTGHGREYREALFGKWGSIDTDDAAECAAYFVDTGKVNPAGIGITGSSAGGYTTLQSLIRYPRTFAAGVCVSGISDVKTMGESTHKLEATYIDTLVLPKGTSEADRDGIYRERSPIYHTDKIRSPLLLLHGTNDKVCPIEQASLFAAAVKEHGGDVKIVEVEGEGHGLHSLKGARVWLKEEEAMWRRTLLSE